MTGPDGRCALGVLWGEGYEVTARAGPGPMMTQTASDVSAPGEAEFTFGEGRP